MPRLEYYVNVAFIDCIPFLFGFIEYLANSYCPLFFWVHQCEGGDSSEKSLSLFIAPDGYAILVSHKISFWFLIFFVYETS